MKPGHSDITSHINFKLFHKILKKNNLNVKKITTQNEFLKKIGILERANILSKKMTFKEKANMFYRLKRLLDYREMGIFLKYYLLKKKVENFLWVFNYVFFKKIKKFENLKHCFFSRKNGFSKDTMQV